MIAVASITIGIQFGWALQLSLLTPYIQLIDVSYKCPRQHLALRAHDQLKDGSAELDEG